MTSPDILRVAEGPALSSLLYTLLTHRIVIGHVAQ